MKRPRKWAQPGWNIALDPLRHASPLLVDALGSAGLDLAGFIDNANGYPAGVVGVMRVHPLRRDGGTVQLVDAAGILRRCEIQRRSDCLEMSMTLGHRAVVATDRNRARLTLEAIPETLRIAAKGRPLSALVDHPILQREEYIVRKIRAFGRFGIVVVTFDAPMVDIDAAVANRLDARDRP